MECKILDMPPHWPAGTTHAIRVLVIQLAAGEACETSLYRTVPQPSSLIGTKAGHADLNGNAEFSFSVTFTQPGIGVLHCEVEAGVLFDSDSHGTLVS